MPIKYKTTTFDTKTNSIQGANHSLEHEMTILMIYQDENWNSEKVLKIVRAGRVCGYVHVVTTGVQDNQYQRLSGLETSFGHSILELHTNADTSKSRILVQRIWYLASKLGIASIWLVHAHKKEKRKKESSKKKSSKKRSVVRKKVERTRCKKNCCQY